MQPLFYNFFSFRGRIRRTEYGLSAFIYFVVVGLVSYTTMETSLEAYYPFFILPFALLLWLQGEKRCHDLGHSGWWQFIPFLFFWLLFADGQPYPNPYGDDPKGRGDLVDGLFS